MSLPLLTIVVGGFIALMMGLVWWAHLKTQERREVWQQIATQRGGTYYEPTWALFTSSSEAIEVPVGHAIVRLDLYVVSSGKSSTTYTRVRARFAVSNGPHFRVYEEGIFSSLGKALGTQDLVLGDPAFDEIFMVKGDDLPGLQRVWTAPARRAMVGVLRRVRAESDGREVKLLTLGALSSPATLDAMLDLAGELASDGARELDALADLEDAELVAARGRWDAPEAPYLSIATGHGDIKAVVRSSATGPRLRLTITAQREVPPFSADIAAGQADGLPKGVLTERAAAMLASLEGATLSGQKHRLGLVWPEVPSATTVQSGAKLLAELAGGARSVGAFR